MPAPGSSQPSQTGLRWETAPGPPGRRLGVELHVTTHPLNKTLLQKLQLHVLYKHGSLILRTLAD